jgi:phage I-like protein
MAGTESELQTEHFRWHRVEASQKSTEEVPTDRLVEGQFSWALDPKAPGEIMYMPAGKHTINARVGGEPKELEVKITAKTAVKLQADLEALLAENVEPFIDFDHKGEASAGIPRAFKWVQGKGVFLELEWSKGGKEAVEGKDYRYFSPTFNIGPDGSPSGLPESGAIGALVNNPAFRDMERIAAAHGRTTKTNGSDADEDQTMSAKLKSTLKALGIIGKDDDDMSDEDMADRLQKKVKGWQKRDDDEAKAAEAAAEAAKAKAKMKGAKKEEDEDDSEDMKTAKAELATLKAEMATTAVEAAIAQGKIPGKNEEIKTFYVEAYIAKPEETKKVLAALPTRGVFTPVVAPDGRDRRDINGAAAASEAGASKKGSPEYQIMMAQRELEATIKARLTPFGGKPPSIDLVQATAKREHPEFYVET